MTKPNSNSLLTFLTIISFACGGEQAMDMGPDLGPDQGSGEQDGGAVDLGTPSDAFITPVCGDVSMLDFELDGAEQNGVFTISGTLSAVDDFRGSCSSDFIGADAVVRFVAPATGTYRFSTLASAPSLNTVLYARRDCLDTSSEVACNDDDGLSERSTLHFELNAQAEIFLIVDSYRGLEEAAFVLTAEQVGTTAPTITQLTPRYNETLGTLGIVIQGEDPDEDPRAVQLTLLNGSDIVPIEGVETFEFLFSPDTLATVQTSEGSFTARLGLALPLSVPLDAFDRVRVAIIDETGQMSAPTDAEWLPPEEVSLGEPCDPLFAHTVCETGSSCAPDAKSAFVCSAFEAPVLTTAEVWLNLDARALGVRVEGMDVDADPDGIRVTLLDATAALIGPQLESNANFEMDGANFIGIASGVIGPSLLLDEAMRAEVQVIDQTGALSSTVSVALAATPTVMIGEACDEAQGLALCEAQAVCINELCQTLETSCPMAWPVIELADHVQGNGYIYQGDTTGLPNRVGAGSCGGGGPQSILHFIAPTTDRYRFEISAAMNADTLMFARTHCGLSAPAYELACNDDIDASASNFWSALELQMGAGAELFLFVDGYYDPASGAQGYEGPFTLVVTRVTP